MWTNNFKTLQISLQTQSASNRRGCGTSCSTRYGWIEHVHKSVFIQQPFFSSFWRFLLGLHLASTLNNWYQINHLTFFSLSWNAQWHRLLATCSANCCFLMFSQLWSVKFAFPFKWATIAGTTIGQQTFYFGAEMWTRLCIVIGVNFYPRELYGVLHFTCLPGSKSCMNFEDE